jgi:aspartyl-tRNA(Asn)/glutamyl-tRNA(Gln) amidotransferase subunit A
MPILPPTFDDINKLTPLQNYMMDIMTVGPNFAGLPHISVNIGMEKNLPIGMMMIADHLQEGKLLQFAKEVEK